MIQIPFYETSGMVLSNFSAHRIEYEGVEYPTVEHAFHAQKFGEGSVKERITRAGSPLVAWELGRKYKPERRADWDDVKVGVLTELVRAKATQHDEVANALILTGEEEIVELNPDDSFWGTGPDGNGDNHMGKILMRIREELKEKNA